MGHNPSEFEGANRPVDSVSWDDCQRFCEKLSKLTGKRFRLPTEAEWEYACRAGTPTPFSFGKAISPKWANYNGNFAYHHGRKGKYREQTSDVGSFPANLWGLADMHGNVWEWCADWHGPYPPVEVQDPQGADRGRGRVLRGGSWRNAPKACRSACRGRSVPEKSYAVYATPSTVAGCA
jgi:formylglycine-generating enzyme required for sulfatase activity